MPHMRSKLETGIGDSLQQDDKDVPRPVLPDLFEAQVARTPDAVALVFGDEELTYGEVNARANRLTRYLVSQGAGPEQIVALALPRTEQMIVALLAVLKAGAAYLPVDPEYPAERIAFMLGDACPTLLLTTAQTDSRIPQGTVASRLVLDQEKFSQAISRLPETNLTDADRISPLLPAHPAYVIYTSGSTGKPKGVVVPHAAIVNSLLWVQSRSMLTRDDRFLHKTSFGFDVAVAEIFWPLLVGAVTVIPSTDEQSNNPEAILRVVEKYRVTAMHFVPSMLYSFLECSPGDAFDSVRLIVCGGETLSAELVKRFYQRFDAALHNMYGPTEASVYVTAYEYVRAQAAYK
jgi:amino acid adenylation domain-containing protein